MRLFCVWNRNYKLAFVVSSDIDAALTLAASKGHLKRPDGFRKWREDIDPEGAEVPDLARDLLARGEEGVITTAPPRTDWFIIE